MAVLRVTVVCLAIALAGGLAGDLSAASPKERLKEKRAQAAVVLSQVNGLDRRFEASVEAWNGARYDLQRTRAELRVERATLRVAERRRRVAVARVQRRLVALYENGADPTTIEILFGSKTLSEIIDRLDAARAIASADHRLAVQATQARNRYAAAARRTAALERSRAETSGRRDAERRQIGALLSQRRRLLASVQSEVAALQAEEARRQAALAAQARARLAHEQALERAAAEARARAAKAAAAAAQAQTAPAPSPTTTAPAPPAPATTTEPTTTTTTSTPPPPTTTDTTPTAPLPPGHPEAASIALRYLGVKYVFGGASPDGFDCSGLVMYVYAQLGIQLPHYAAAQFGLGVPVPRDQLQPGDLVFFDGLDHVGIYIGGGQMVHAPQTGDVVKITAISDFGDRYVGARRI
jgi:peptidoglycan DL-endopeptidase CwlO